MKKQICHYLYGRERGRKGERERRRKENKEGKEGRKKRVKGRKEERNCMYIFAFMAVNWL